MTIHKKITIGLFGFGVVGEGIYKVLLQTPTLNAVIKKICIKQEDKKRGAPASLFTTDAEELLNDDDIDIIVELIDDADAAYHIVTLALKNKKSVVSANKKLIAEHLSELIQLQNQNDVSFLYEAAVCGSIPVIRNLEEYYDNDLLNSFSGIVNGSTNFILTKMKEENLSFENALLQAQQLGFAESNPALDVEGIDAVNKLTIILKHAYGISTHPSSILHKGITHLDPLDIQYANEKGIQIKLVATAKQLSDNKIVSYVLPTFVDNQSQLFNVKNEYNGVLIGSKLADEQFLYGKGAGRYPTSSAVLSDISALSYDYRYEYKKSNFGINYVLSNDYLISVFVSFNHHNDIDEFDFEEIIERHYGINRNYITGLIQIEKLKNSTWFKHSNVSVIAHELEKKKEFVEQIFFEKELV